MRPYRRPASLADAEPSGPDASASALDSGRVEGLAVALVLLALGAVVAVSAAAEGDSPSGAVMGIGMIFLAIWALVSTRDRIKNS